MSPETHQAAVELLATIERGRDVYAKFHEAHQRVNAQDIAYKNAAHNLRATLSSKEDHHLLVNGKLIDIRRGYPAEQGIYLPPLDSTVVEPVDDNAPF